VPPNQEANEKRLAEAQHRRIQNKNEKESKFQ
jgi:hypothetical protein